MRKIIITQSQLNRFGGDKDWAVADEVLNHLSEEELRKYDDGIMTDKHVKIMDENKNIVAEFLYQIEA